MPLRERKVRTRSPKAIKNGLRNGSRELPTSTKAVDDSFTQNSINLKKKLTPTRQGKTLDTE
jgi:hypothetical protein